MSTINKNYLFLVKSTKPTYTHAKSSAVEDTEVIYNLVKDNRVRSTINNSLVSTLIPNAFNYYKFISNDLNDDKEEILLLSLPPLLVYLLIYYH